MDPLASLRRRPHRITSPAGAVHGRSASTQERRAQSDHGKPTLDAAEYLAELNGRLRRHPMYMEGMHFPNPQPGSTPMLAAALAWEGPWDSLGVFMSVAEDVAREYDLDGSAHAPAGRS
ncbi:MAG: hypothetical protein EOO28_21095 [Comamonadaceae bacterium]|nr:MAG: hypothetical protein EOO28_21095 [Comamonadaceae bacterium]